MESFWHVCHGAHMNLCYLLAVQRMGQWACGGFSRAPPMATIKNITFLHLFQSKYYLTYRGCVASSSRNLIRTVVLTTTVLYFNGKTLANDEIFNHNSHLTTLGCKRTCWNNDSCYRGDFPPFFLCLLLLYVITWMSLRVFYCPS